ncbi:hypothetical protein N7466_000182 [Penicillium verhagenii]|uniref:uncharacterized protein n=1 Tax=Penicillium verhagenii TaxID=1562060 RepID=UPI002545272F|nr:uncharacterized protein N7466_000182 [Penicillium verhagenii]KAJ5947167.1 hypothetical protein N7466_000182 [Penicillium verhagenii]
MAGPSPQTNNTTPATPPRRLLLVSIPRTASNLLLKILNIPQQPNLLTSAKGGYFFYPAYTKAAAALNNNLPHKPISQWTDDQKAEAQRSFQECFNTLEEYSTQASTTHKMMFAKEHAYWLYSPAALHKASTGIHDEALFNEFRIAMPEQYGAAQTYSRLNETVFSDEYLRSWQLAFIIRHPALAWPSMYRAMVKIGESGLLDEDGVRGASFSNMDMRWTRLMYEWCLEQPDRPVPPPVIDAHDLVHNPGVVGEFCERTGLDKGVVQFEWAEQGETRKSAKWGSHVVGEGAEEVSLHQRAAGVMLSTLESSSGVVRDKAPEDVDIDVEAAKWRVEFGEEIGGLVEEYVRKSMPDYEYLKARRITV